MTCAKLPGSSRCGGRSRSPARIRTRSDRPLRTTLSPARRTRPRSRFDAGDAAAGNAHGEAKRRGAGAAAEIEHGLAGLRGDRGGEQHRIDRRAVALRRLHQPDPAAEQRVVGEVAAVGRIGHAERSVASRSSATGAFVVAVGDHQPALNGADAAFDDAGVIVEHQRSRCRNRPGKSEPRTGTQDRCCG